MSSLHSTTGGRDVGIRQGTRPIGVLHHSIRFCLMACPWLLLGCGEGSQHPFVDITKDSGIEFVHFAGAEGAYHLPETMGGGGGFFDYDGDGDLDILLLNGCSWEERDDDPTMALYRNLGERRFEDVTEEAGLDVVIRSMGMCAADYDNDGDQDLLITGHEKNLFFINDGQGRFEEASGKVGLVQGRWATSASFFDYDLDGYLDLIVGNYLKWDPAVEERGNCVYAQGNRDYCPVGIFPPERMILYQNQGDGTFQDVTVQAGLAELDCKCLGIAIVDYDRDHWPDIFVANDTYPYQLLRNNGDGTFEDRALDTGMALSETGSTYAGMGVDFTYEDDGEALAFAVGNFSGEPVTFRRQWRDEGTLERECFVEEAFTMGLARATMRMVTFGLFFFDYDLDGSEDLFIVNGHVGETQVLEGIPYKQPCQLVRRSGDSFEEIVGQPGDPVAEPIIGRGAAYGDIDGDGDLDILVLENQGPARLLENRIQKRGGFLRVVAQGVESNRDGLGAEVCVEVGDRVMRDRVVNGTSYLSQHELALTFGIGDATTVDRVTVTWPSGLIDVYRNVNANQKIVCREGETAGERVTIARPLAFDCGENSLAWKRDGISRMEEGDLEGAHVLLEKASKALPRDHIAQLQYARVLYALGHEAKARVQIHQLFDLFDDFDFLSLGAANFLLNIGDRDVELLVLEECLRRRPKESWIHSRVGQAQYFRGLYQEALWAFERALHYKPDNFEAMLGQATCQFRLGRLDDAATNCESLLELNPTSNGYMTLGMIYREQGLARAAIDALEKSCELDPKGQENRSNLISLHDQLGNHKEVERHIHINFQSRPDSSQAWTGMITILARKGDRQGVVSMARQGLAKFDSDPELLFLAARAEFEFVGDVRRALSLVRQSVKYREDHLGSWKLRHALGMRLGSGVDVLESLENICLLEPGNEKAYQQLTQVRQVAAAVER